MKSFLAIVLFSILLVACNRPNTPSTPVPPPTVEVPVTPPTEIPPVEVAK